MWTLETAVSKLAFPSAFFSAVYKGNYLIRGVKGAVTVGALVKQGIEVIVNNDGVVDVVTKVGFGAIDCIGKLSKNLIEDTETTIYSIIGTYIGIKAIPYASKLIRKNMFKKRKHNTSKPNRNLS